MTSLPDCIKGTAPGLVELLVTGRETSASVAVCLRDYDAALIVGPGFYFIGFLSVTIFFKNTIDPPPLTPILPRPTPPPYKSLVTFAVILKN